MWRGSTPATPRQPTTRPARCRPLQNTEIANQANLDVVINSSDPNYNNSTDYTDGGVGVNADPCYKHTPGTDTISPGGGQWTDVRVKERNLPSIFGGIGLPLSRAGARARVEIRPAISGHRFLPLAVPNNVIEKVQVRYYNECTGAEIVSARTDLGPLPAATSRPSSRRAAGRCGRRRTYPARATRASESNLVLPQYDPACGDYVPVGEEVRLASRAEVDLNQTCAQLVTARYADCFHRLSQIRIWNDGNPNVPAAAEGRPRDGRLRRARRRVLQPAPLRRERLPVHRHGRGPLGHAWHVGDRT